MHKICQPLFQNNAFTRTERRITQPFVWIKASSEMKGMTSIAGQKEPELQLAFGSGRWDRGYGEEGLDARSSFSGVNISPAVYILRLPSVSARSLPVFPLYASSQRLIEAPNGCNTQPRSDNLASCMQCDYNIRTD